ncbi:MAG: alpha-2-macroglobulin, partial [Pseudomonadota bacterium]
MRTLFAKVRWILGSILGRWEPPPWLRLLGRGVARGGGWARAHRAASAAILVTLAFLGTGGVLGWRWWKQRPRPVTTEVTVTAPELTRIADKPVPYPVLVDFADSVAPLKDIGRSVGAGVELRPPIAGAWKWTSDRQLSFMPKGDWPVGQHFEVRFAKLGLCAAHVKLAKYELEFSTAPFTATLTEAEFYQDPVDPSLKKVVATFQFSHPVDPTSFEKHVRMHFEPSNKEERAFDAELKTSYDKWKAQAFVCSAPFAIPQKDAKMLVSLDEGARAAAGGPPFAGPLAQEVLVPGLYNFFRVYGAEMEVVDNERMEPEQVLSLRLSAGATEKEIGQHVSAWLLPVTNPDEPPGSSAGEARRPYRYYDVSRISPAILKAGRKLELRQLAADKEYADVHSFRFDAEIGRFLYLEVRKGARAFGGYVLGEPFLSILEVTPFPRQIKFMQSGSLLALSGERRVTLFARDVPGVRFEVARVLPDQLHHLVTQSYGQFARPDFRYDFGPQNLADFWTETRAMKAARGKPAYESLDLSPYLADGHRGLFIVKAESWDPQSKDTLGEEDQRLVLVSDLGLLAKRWADGSQDVFVQSIRNGEPVAGARVEVIGKNGVAVLSATTDNLGQVHFPPIGSFHAEKEAVLYLASLGRDSTFLPIGRADRMLDLSRFDVGGIHEAVEPQSLSAYLFSDRGVYRPGDEMRIGTVVKPKDWSQSLEGLPLLAVVIDARGLEVKRQKLVMGAAGFEEIRHTTPEVAPTGTYSVNLYTVKDEKPAALLGFTTVQVREFLPDRMIIKANLSEERIDGWVAPANLKGRVTLTNLFGTPASGRRVRSSVTLVPGLPTFSKLAGFRFFDPLKAREPVTQDLTDVKTGDDGRAEISLDLERYANATYRLTFVAEGFEAEGGRSVTAETSVVVSPLPYLVGWKADGELRYIGHGTPRSIELVAVGPTGDRKDVGGLSAVLLERKYVSVLVRQDNGTYKYESVKKDVEQSREPLAIAAAGTRWRAPTKTPGDFALSLRNDKGDEIQRIDFSISGYGDLARSMEKNAELQLALKSADVEVGGTLEVQIKAPYTGAGLITIERDRVYAVKWFKTATTATVETIQVPAELEGGGYLSVVFIRDPGSAEVFASPLSYGVVPFSVSRARRAVDVRVEAAELVKPGERLTLKVSADKKARAVVFAVDEGILRVAHYRAPDPLGYFFQKRALRVSTTQILDLILPEHERLLQALAPGGDADGEAAIGANLNPFRRRRDKPVAFWSGLVDVGPTAKELHYDVPDYWSGTLRIMAVAISPEAVGAFARTATVRGDFTLTPNVPTFVAPGDTFEVPVLVSNNVAGSGAKAQVTVELAVSPHLEVVGDSNKLITARMGRQVVAVGEMRETTATFKLLAKDVLGSASLTFHAHLSEKSGQITTDLSVRPGVPMLTTLKAGYLKDGKTRVPIPRQLYPEYRVLEAGISPLPLQLARGLASYLEELPHGCTEQVVSQAVPAVVLGKRPELGLAPAKVNETVARLVDILRTRQNDDGAFGLWAANPRVVPEVTVYAIHVLIEARERGYSIPADLVAKAIPYLQGLAGSAPDDLPAARVRAHAIYVLTRNEMVTGTFAAAAQKNLEANHPVEWKEDLAGAYLAATYRLLRQDRQAAELMAKQRFGQSVSADWENYYDRLVHDGQLLYLLARHFPEQASAVRQAEIDALVEPIASGNFNTFSSASAILGLEAFAKQANASGSGSGSGQRSIAEVVDGTARPLVLPEGWLPTVQFSEKAAELVFGSEGSFGSYYLVTQRGFDRFPEKQVQGAKIEVFR